MKIQNTRWVSPEKKVPLPHNNQNINIENIKKKEYKKLKWEK